MGSDTFFAALITFQVREIFVDVLGALYFDQVGEHLLLPAPLNLRVGCVGEKTRPDHHDHYLDNGKPRRLVPPLLATVLVGEVVEGVKRQRWQH